MTQTLLKKLVGALFILFVDYRTKCDATTPLELAEVIERWKLSCVGKEFETSGIGTQLVVDLKKDPFVGIDELTLFKSQMRIRFYGSAIAIELKNARQGAVIDIAPQGYGVWFNGRATGFQDAIGTSEIVVVDGPDPVGDGFGAESGLMLVGWGLARNRTISDLLKFYDAWEVVKSDNSSKIFRGSSANGTMDVSVSTDSSSGPVISSLLGNLRFKHPASGDPIKLDFFVLYQFGNTSPNEFIPSVAESRTIGTVKGNRYSHASRFAISSSIRRAKPFQKLADGLPRVPNGTRVQVDDQMGIEFQWHDGEIVRKIDREKVTSMLGFKFVGTKWLIPGLLLVIAGGTSAIWWRHIKKAK